MDQVCGNCEQLILAEPLGSSFPHHVSIDNAHFATAVPERMKPKGNCMHMWFSSGGSHLPAKVSPAPFLHVPALQLSAL